jgi:hypothetical protein
MKKQIDLRVAWKRNDKETNWLERSWNKGRFSKVTTFREVGIKEGWGKILIWEQQRKRMRIQIDLLVAGIKDGWGKKQYLEK